MRENYQEEGPMMKITPKLYIAKDEYLVQHYTRRTIDPVQTEFSELYTLVIKNDTTQTHITSTAFAVISIII